MYNQAIELLKKLIATPSISKEETATATIIEDFLHQHGVKSFRKNNNIWAFNAFFDPKKPSILLNSHHDTVKPNAAYTRNPFAPDIHEGKLFGLGSNDAGGALVSLIVTFLHFYRQENLHYNVVLATTAEEEISGYNGIELILPELGSLDFAIVGEPTLMNLAIAERGLLVLDCIAYGKSGHAARNEGDNAIYKALKDIEWFRSFKFSKISSTLGDTTMNVTVIQAGTQHNVVPEQCHFTVDIRITDAYTHNEVLSIIQQHISSEIKPRSTRLKSSSIPLEHPIVQAGIALGRNTYGSPTSSDQALLNIPSLKLGPGDSARSHTADEFIYLSEIEEGIDIYIKILRQILSL